MIEYTPHPDSKQSEKAYKTLERLLLARREQRVYLNQQTSDFADALFIALHQAVYECQERGLTELGEPRYLEHPAGGGRRALQIPIEDWSVIFVPLVGTAWPNMRDEAQIPGAAFRELCGRIAVFIGSESEATSFFDFLILTNGSWFAWGFGWPKQAASTALARSWIQRVTVASAGPPVGGLYLSPPSSGGLCDGVITIRSASPRDLPRLNVRIAWETTGVGV